MSERYSVGDKLVYEVPETTFGYVMILKKTEIDDSFTTDKMYLVVAITDILQLQPRYHTWTWHRAGDIFFVHYNDLHEIKKAP